VEGLSCYVALRHGVPVLAAGAIGRSLLAANLQTTIMVLGQGLDLGQAIALPRWGSFAPSQRGGRPAYIMHVEAFDEAVLRAVEGLGQPVARAPYVDTGYWAAVGRDPATGVKCAVTEPRFLGLALGD
jgi:gamma-glutamyltranspeptidase